MRSCLRLADLNLKSFRRSGIVNYYRQLRQLQPAEESIFKQLEPQLGEMKVLDLGVGAGRTALHLAPRVSEYIGVDYSPEMIEICQQRFANLDTHVSFQICDVRDLSRFAQHSFDFVFFSFNGIDNMSHRERLNFFQEVLRVCKPSGYFAFSTHNLQGIISEFSLAARLSWNPLTSYVNGIMWVFLKLFNRSLSATKLQQLEYAVIRDESHNFRLRQYYIRPRAQLEQLHPYFKEITVYSWQSGEAIADSDLEAQQDMWCYYLCKLPSDIK